RRYFSQDAVASINVNRDEQDSYEIRIVPIDGILAPRLTRANVIPLLPVGSNWRPSVGWHSYFGIPFRLERETYLAVGAQLVRPHQSRGAYVSFFAFIFPRDHFPVRQLLELAHELRSASNQS